MPNDKEHFVSVEVSKDQLDGAVLGEKNTMQFANTKKGSGKLVRCQPPLSVGKSEECKQLSALVGWPR